MEVRFPMSPIIKNNFHDNQVLPQYDAKKKRNRRNINIICSSKKSATVSTYVSEYRLDFSESVSACVIKRKT